MSNPAGDFRFQANGKAYTLRYSVNALCALEEKIGDAGALEGLLAQADANKVRIAGMRTLFWAGLIQHHPGITEEVAGNLMDAIGMTPAIELAAKALMASFPEMGANSGKARAAGKPGKRS